MSVDSRTEFTSKALPDQSQYLLAPAGPGGGQNSTEAFLLGAAATQLPGDFVFQLRF